MAGKQKDIEVFIKYPPWATMKVATALFGVGKDRINEWADKGFVLRLVQGKTSRQFRCSDIDRVMTDIATGKTPRLARFCK